MQAFLDRINEWGYALGQMLEGQLEASIGGAHLPGSQRRVPVVLPLEIVAELFEAPVHDHAVQDLVDRSGQRKGIAGVRRAAVPQLVG